MVSSPTSSLRCTPSPTVAQDAPSPERGDVASAQSTQADRRLPGGCDSRPALLPPVRPSPWLRLPTEVKLAIYAHCEIPGYVGLALADSENYALAQQMPAWRWQRREMSTCFAGAETHAERAALLLAYARTVRAMPCPLELPDNSPQHLIQTAHDVLFGSGQHATVRIDELAAFAALDAIPTGVRACLDLGFEDEDVALRFLQTPQPSGLFAADLSGLSLGDYLGQGGRHRLLEDTVRELSVDGNSLHAAILILPNQLQRLSLQHNGLRAPQLEDWRFPPTLRVLNLAVNPLGAMPTNLPDELDYLDLACTGLTGTDLLSASLPQRLTFLQLRGNSVSEQEYNLLCARYPHTTIQLHPR